MDYLKSNFLSIIALIISLLSVYYAYQTNKLTSYSLKMHLDPEISCNLEYREKPKPHLYFSLFNKSAITASHIFVNYREIFYDKSLQLAKASHPGGSASLLLDESSRLAGTAITGDRWIYEPELRPDSHLSKAIDSVYLRDDISKIHERYSPENMIIIENFSITYYRDTDGQKFDKICRFYIEDKQMYGRKGFRNKDYFNTVERSVEKHLHNVESFRDTPSPFLATE